MIDKRRKIYQYNKYNTNDDWCMKDCIYYSDDVYNMRMFYL